MKALIPDCVDDYCCVRAALDRLDAMGALVTSCCGKAEGKWRCNSCGKLYCTEYDCLAKVANYRIKGTGRSCAKDAYYHEDYPVWYDRDSD